VPLLVAALAALSLLLPFALAYDPWAWLIWGREIVELDLDTEAGPSWKPLPVGVTALVAPAGDAAPELWTVVARAGWLASLVLAWVLAARLAVPAGVRFRLVGRLAPARLRRARIVAGALAALGLLLLHDEFTPWARQFAGGLSEPLLVALVLGAIERELAGRSGQALALGAGAALLRPEAWPLLAAYGWLLWRREPDMRRTLVACGLAVPALWLVPDLLGSGDPFTGARRAREATGSPPYEALEAIGRALDMVLWGLLAAAGYAVWTARRTGERPIVVLAVGAAAWIAIVAVLAAAGYAGIPRFAAPAAAVACVLGSVGVVRLLARLGGGPLRDRRRRPLVIACAALAVALAVQGASRAADMPGDLREAEDFNEGVGDLFAVVDGAGRVVACSPVTTTDFLTETALAWRLEQPLGSIGRRFESAPRTGIAFVDADASAAARGAVAATGEPVARRGRWTAYEVSCAIN
jgi:hypothetical protein